ncbi:nicotinamide-nucleotide amidohydrolase family protein [Acetobacteraceae bacterium KSS8]|uniref:Nicotinamide-nucleotide amidohydrolase family protein n=1 Tax=Endosaccharibacter trunci TaxID=2812733 RepID=A0ABT1W3A5_9PROT|nr:nicotinamide-nucleotide amidohydrolase family protein [Acetobacteraceae bacterium KSS8]
MDESLLRRSAEALAALQKAELTVATAESCTGGLVSAALTHHAGSSSAILGAAVPYSNAAKHRVLGVPDATLTRFGAVSAEVAEAMATGALNLFGTDIAVAITGIAGPGGGTPEKPVGTVWLGLARRGRPVETRLLSLEGSREAIRLRTAEIALSMVESAAVSP